LAVAAIAIPHLFATAQRWWGLRQYVDRKVLAGFGLASAAGGLAGALAHARLPGDALTGVFGALLLLAGFSELTGWMRRVEWGERAGWVAGAVSGILGGLVGNQGSIRSAAMLGFRVPKESFVATATAVALFVDTARRPVYFSTQWRDLLAIWPVILLVTALTMTGTAIGMRTLSRVSEAAFRRTVAILLIALGLYMTLGAL
jgi:uncharacterized membrane protein YfcA